MMHLVLLFFSAVAAFPNSQTNTPFKVTLPKRQVFTRADGFVDPTFLILLNNTLKKHHSDVLLPSYAGLSSSTSAALERRQSNERVIDQGADELYYGPVTVGGQDFTVDGDTGSADLFIPGPKCNTAAGCPHATKYDQGGVDQENTTTVTYGSGQVTGENYLDTVTMAGLTAKNQGLISLTKAAGFSNSNPDGLLGLGFQNIAASKFTPFFQNLIAQGQVKTQEFSFYLGRTASRTGQNSELTLGGRDTSKFTGALTVVPVTVQGYWQVALDSVVVNGQTSPLTKGQAAIDTGTTIIIAPTAAAFNIFMRIPKAMSVPLVSGSSTLQIFAYPCNTDSKYIPAIQFAGISFQVNPLDFNLGPLTTDFADMVGSSVLTTLISNSPPLAYCMAAIAAVDLDSRQNLYVVGDTFLKNWYSIYSFGATKGGKPAVLFAKSV